jgi:SAM-dependent methyltransferase
MSGTDIPSADGTRGATGPADHYRDARGRTYFARQAAAGTRAAYMNRFIWAPHVRADDDLVEFGCGGGDLLNSLPARRKVGIEINPAAAERARAFGLEVHERLDALPAASFDTAISSHALEHVESPVAILRELRRVLRPGGRLVLLLPLDEWRNAGQRHFRAGDMDMHLYAWTPLTLGNLLTVSGFRPDDVSVLAHAWPPRLADALWNRSERLFHLAARATSVLLKQRQLLARATAV